MVDSDPPTPAAHCSAPSECVLIQEDPLSLPCAITKDYNYVSEIYGNQD